MDNGKASNGNGQVKYAAWVRVDMDMTTHVCAVAGDAPNLDTYIAMLQQALREMEAQQRVARVAELQRAAAEAQANQRIANMVTKGR